MFSEADSISLVVLSYEIGLLGHRVGSVVALALKEILTRGLGRATSSIYQRGLNNLHIFTDAKESKP